MFYVGTYLKYMLYTNVPTYLVFIYIWYTIKVFRQSSFFFIVVEYP